MFCFCRLKDYIRKGGDMINLSGKKSLIKLLSDNIVKRAIDPLYVLFAALTVCVGTDLTCLFLFVMHFVLAVRFQNRWIYFVECQ